MEIDFSEEFMKLHASPIAFEDNDDEYKKHATEDSDIKYIKEKHKKKKDKKKKKEPFDFMGDLSVLEEDYVNSSVMDEDTDSLIFKKSKKGAKKDLFDMKEAKKKSKKNIEAKFNPEIMELKKILKDANIAYEDIKEILKNILESKSRYVGKTLTDLLQALNTANTNRMNIIQHIANIKKTIVDLNLKTDKINPKKKEDEFDEEAIGLDIFRTLLGKKKGRKEFMKEANQYFREKNNDGDEEFNDGFDIMEDDEDANNIINQRLSNENNIYRSEDGNKYIQYEDLDPQDCIIYYTNGEWDIDAIDKNGNSMPNDYPRMSKQDLGNVSFDLEQDRARDEFGRTFMVIQK